MMKIKVLAAVFTLTLLACSSDDVENPDPCESGALTVWQGGTMVFSKGDNTNPTDPANQDRITDNVWLTRDNNGGGLYNAAVEPAEDKQSSPEGTEWAKGRLENVCDLTYGTFRGAVGKPKDIVGENLVLHLIEDDIYLSVRISQWSEGNAGGGGFTYTRSTQ